ncbi:hypothetical protein [Algirhabdus cladophorae]|uniref:FliH/SctL family protein n=1 Tax=Algirhabdus cladophorae TaxID=3377108 RepID=UPI003B845136
MIRVSLEKVKSRSQSDTPSGSPAVMAGDEQAEDIRLAAFEDGYRAGWDDASKTNQDNQNKLSMDLVQCFQDFSFGHAEARQHVIKSIEPVLSEVVAKVLPKTAELALVPMVVDAIMDMLSEASQQPVTILVSPENETAVSGSLPDDVAEVVQIEPDPVVGLNQARLVGTSKTVELDLSKALQDISQILQDFFKLETGGQNDGR